MAEEIITSTNAETATDHEYNASEIQVLKGLEAVRKRPGMYIGSTGERGLHHLVYEIVDNAIDEALAGYCDHIEVKILKGDIIQVTDNGRGIPVDIQADTGLPAVTVVYTILHAGGKFGGENSGYKVAGGLHGVGASVVNACSEWLTVNVRRDGHEYEQTFRRGDPDGPLKCIGTVDPSVTGTRVTFKPDPEMFKDTTVYNFETLEKRLREESFLNAGVKITLTDERELYTPVLEDGGVELALVGQGDLDTGVQEALFPQALFQRFEVVDGGVLEHLRVGLEGDAGAGDTGVHGADALQRAVRVAAAEGLLVLVAVAADVDGQPLRAGVDDGRADAVQAAGHLVAGILAAELAAGVEDGIDDGDGRQTGISLDVHGDAAAIVRDLNDVALQDLDLDVVAVTGQSLVDGVVHDLVHQMVQAALAGGADIHTGALAHCLQAFQDLDLAGVVFMVRRSFCVGTGNDFLCHFLSPFCFVSFFRYYL